MTGGSSLSEIRELIAEYDNEAKQLKTHADLTTKDKATFQDRFMLHFWTTYPMRNDLNNTQVITRRAFNALDQVEKDNKNYVILGKTPTLSIGNYKTMSGFIAISAFQDAAPWVKDSPARGKAVQVDIRLTLG